jgi:hypothetical protein
MMAKETMRSKKKRELLMEIKMMICQQMGLNLKMM